MALSLSTISMPSQDVVAREVAGEWLVFLRTAGASEMEDELCALNESGQAVWQQLDGRRTLGEVIDALAAEFASPRDEIAADVLRFVAEMLQRNILITV